MAKTSKRNLAQLEKAGYLSRRRAAEGLRQLADQIDSKPDERMVKFVLNLYYSLPLVGCIEIDDPRGHLQSVSYVSGQEGR